jgi:DNA-binding NtrC family response regulator
MWFGTWTGVSCFDGSRFINYGTDDGMWSSAVFDIIEDREKQMWFAHAQLCGLSCYAQTVNLLTDEPAGWTCAQDKKGRIWSGGIDVNGIRPDSQASAVEQRRISFTSGGTYIMVDSRDRLWIAPVRDGLYCYDSDAAWETAGGDELSIPRHFGVSDNLADREYVIPLLEMEDGTIWFSLLNPPSTEQYSRLCRFDPDQLSDGEPLESIDVKRRITCLIKDKQGRLWMGTQYHEGLFCWDGNKLTTYTQEDGLPNNYIRSLVEDDSGQIWIGTNHGLCCFDGQRFVTYGEEYGLRDLYHWQSARDASGRLWFAARGGIYHTDGKHFQWLTEDDGLPSNKVVGVFPHADGSMAIWTGRGLVIYRPTAIIPLGVEIREVVADRAYQNPDEIELTTTAANLLTISYHGLSLATKKMRYSYVLEGYDEKWRETWDRQARYENLPVGEYTFKVIAINRDLMPSEAPATMKLTVIRDPRDVRINNLRTEVENLRREAGRKYDFHSVVGQSIAIKQVHALMERAIDSGLTVLIIGETGTGKELVAKAIHYNSSRKDGPLRDLNCGAVPKELVSSTLFGYRKGAFTGATEDRIGLFEAASGGTLLLDEIGEMPQDAQIHLLRVLEESKIQRVGDNISRDVDVRIIAMTNRELIKEVEDRRFRKDLYYRLSVFPIYVPPLRERPEDIPLLAEHFLQEMDKGLADLAPDVLDMLQSYSWPGNVRELLNAIRRADALAEEGKQIQTYHFSSQITQGESLIQGIISEKMGLSASLELLQRRLIENALRECNGNRTRAAQMLNTQRPNLVRIMRRLGIE